jgi:uncharacterized membrane protein
MGKHLEKQSRSKTNIGMDCRKTGFELIYDRVMALVLTVLDIRILLSQGSQHIRWLLLMLSKMIYYLVALP